MKQLRIIILLCIFASTIAICNGQDCYNGRRNTAIEYYNQKNYEKAMNLFEAAKNCPDMPAKNDLVIWIDKCKNAMTKPIPIQDISLDVSNKNLSFKSSGGLSYVTITIKPISEKWFFSYDDISNWCVATKEGSQLKVVCKANTESKKRFGRIMITAKEKNTFISITQEANDVADEKLISINDIQFANANYNGNYIDDYGSDLYNDMKYLKAKLLYSSNSDTQKEIILDVKVINPDGTCKTGKTSPSGYSFQNEISLQGKGNHDLVLLGWGNEEGTSYSKTGVYKYEIWCKGTKLFAKDVVVKQRGLLTVSTKFISFDNTRETKSIIVTSDQSWTIELKPSWCTITTYDTYFEITCSENISTTERSDWFKVKSGDKEEKITVQQSGAASIKIGLSSTHESFSASGGSRTINVFANNSWEIVYLPSWCSVFKSTDHFTLTCNNNTSIARSSWFYVKSGEKQIKVTVEQQSFIDNSTSQYNKSNTNTIKSNRKYPMRVKMDHALVGLSMGYVQKKSLINEGGYISEYGFWDEKALQGAQIGIKVNPYFCRKKMGLGMNLGVFYEFYYQTTNIEGVQANFIEHVIYVPVHLMYRYDISDKFGLFIHGGIGADIGISAKIKASYLSESFDFDNIYGDTDWGDLKRLNVYGEFGGGLQVLRMLFSVTTSFGLFDQSEYTTYIKKQNKPISASLTIMF